MPGALSRTVVVLGVASLLTDLSSDMIYPLLPAFVAVTLGAGAIGLGAMEGAAETTAAFLKVASGKLADHARRKKPLVIAGYSLSGAVRPLFGFAASWPVVIFLRLLDRVGKGIRTAPRDALIADVTPAAMRGRAYGLHRAMDNAGAVLGPLAAAALLGLGLGVRQVFFAAAIPALVVVLVLVPGVRESPNTTRANGETPATRAGLAELGPGFRRVLLVIVLFTLGNSSDMFLLLRLQESGLDATGVTLAWAAHNLVRTLAVYGGGHLADRFDKRKLLDVGWLFYAASYGALAFASTPLALVAVIVVYALHYGAVEPTERAIVAELAPPGLRGSAFGWFHGAVGLTALPASALAGVLWKISGPPLAFAVGAALALVAAIALRFWVPPAPAQPS